MAVRREVAGAHKLEPLAGAGFRQAGFQLGVADHHDAFGVQVILEVGPLGDAVHVGFGEQLVVQPHLGVHAVLTADPVDGAAHLAAVGRVAAAGFQVGLGVDGRDVAVGVLVHAGAAHKVGAHQPHFAAHRQPLELRRRHFKEIAAVDPHLFGEGHRAGGGVVGVPVGVVGQVKEFALAFGVVVDHQLDRVQHRHAAGCRQLQLSPQHGFQLAHVHKAVCLGDAGPPHELKNARRGVAAAAQAGQGRHAGVVPAVHDALFHQLAQVALAHHGVGHVQAGKFPLLRELAAEQVFDHPVVQRAVILKFQAAQRMGDPLDGVLDRVGKVVQRVDAPLVPLAMVAHMLDAVDGRVAHIHVGAGQVDLGPQCLFAVGKLAGAHTAEQIKVFLRRAVPVGGRPAGLARVVAAVFLHFVAGQVIHIGFAVPDELFGALVAFLKIVAAVKDAPVRVGAQPFQVPQDALHILIALPRRVGIVVAQVELAAVGLGHHVVDVDGLGRPDVQVAVGLRREPGMDLPDLSLRQVGVDDVGQEIGEFFVRHNSTPNRMFQFSYFTIDPANAQAFTGSRSPKWAAR